MLFTTWLVYIKVFLRSLSWSNIKTLSKQFFQDLKELWIILKCVE